MKQQQQPEYTIVGHGHPTVWTIERVLDGKSAAYTPLWPLVAGDKTPRTRIFSNAQMATDYVLTLEDGTAGKPESTDQPLAWVTPDVAKAHVEQRLAENAALPPRHIN